MLKTIAVELGIDAGMVDEARGSGEWMLKEGKLPDNVLPNSSSPIRKNAAAWRACSSAAATQPTGYVLPVQRWNAAATDPRWMSEKWKTRRGRLFLVPGDSPVGYRLPLGAALRPAVAVSLIVPVDPSVPRGPLPSRPEPVAIETAVDEASGRAQIAASFAPTTAQQDRVEQELGEIGGAVRTAISVEPRDGRLTIFMPPVEALEDYLELIAAAAEKPRGGDLKVHIEGYAPPHDPRLNVIRVAPDPGVIEVNIHPASSWADCVATTTAIYEEARQSRLGADKFMIDGKHTGTGGGNRGRRRRDAGMTAHFCGGPIC